MSRNIILILSTLFLLCCNTSNPKTVIFANACKVAKEELQVYLGAKACKPAKTWFRTVKSTARRPPIPENQEFKDYYYDLAIPMNLTNRWIAQFHGDVGSKISLIIPIHMKSPLYANDKLVHQSSISIGNAYSAIGMSNVIRSMYSRADEFIPYESNTNELWIGDAKHTMNFEQYRDTFDIKKSAFDHLFFLKQQQEDNPIMIECVVNCFLDMGHGDLVMSISFPKSWLMNYEDIIKLVRLMIQDLESDQGQYHKK